jgi:hypothetical protein
MARTSMRSRAALTRRSSRRGASRGRSRRQRAPRRASSATSCTRTMSMPAAAASATVAAVAEGAAVDVAPGQRPIVDLREVPSSVGKPSATSRGSAPRNRQIVFGRLAEADARIEDHVLGRNARAHAAFGRRATASTRGSVDDVALVDRAALVVHDRRPAMRSHAASINARRRAPDRIEQIAAGRVRRAVDVGFERVDRDDRRGRGGAHGAHDGHQPAQFFLERSADDRGASTPRPTSRMSRRRRAVRQRALEHRARRSAKPSPENESGLSVDDAHEVRALAPDQARAANLERVSFANAHDIRSHQSRSVPTTKVEPVTTTMSSPSALRRAIASASTGSPMARAPEAELLGHVGQARRARRERPGQLEGVKMNELGNPKSG